MASYNTQLSVQPLQYADENHFVVIHLKKNAETKILTPEKLEDEIPPLKDKQLSLFNPAHHVEIQDPDKLMSEAILYSRKVVLKLDTVDQQGPKDWLREKLLWKSKCRGKSSVIIIYPQGAPGIPSWVTFDREDIYSDRLHEIITILDKDSSLNLKTCHTFGYQGIQLAWSYFFGYLNVQGQDFVNRVFAYESGLRSSSQECRSGNHGNQDLKMSHNYYVIVPESCCCPETLQQLKVDIKQVGSIPFEAYRCGQKRDYNTPVIEVTDEESKMRYRACLVFASNLQTLFEMVGDEISGMKMDDLIYDVQAYFYTLKAICDTKNFKNFKFIYYKDERMHGSNFSQIMLQQIKEDLEAENEGFRVDLCRNSGRHGTNNTSMNQL